MARTFGPIYASIWKDPDFIALPGHAQRLYMLLVSQGDISSCGTLPITLRRWSRMAIDTPIDSISISISILVSEGFIVLDEDTEELIVRSFIKWDKGYKVPKRLMAIKDAIRSMASPTLQQVAIGELAKFDIPFDTPIDMGIDTPIDYPTVPGISNVSREGTGNREPGEGAHSNARRPPDHCSKHPDGTDAPCAACGRARRKVEQWDSDRRRSSKQFAEYLKTQPECAHGIPGGNIDRPNTGTPSCAQCRREKKAA